MLVRFRVYGPIYGMNNFFEGSNYCSKIEKANTGIYIEFLTPKTGVIYFRDILSNEGYSIPLKRTCNQHSLLYWMLTKIWKS